MRRRLADAGVPQPRFAAMRHVREVRAAADAVGFPAVLKPADSAGQRALPRRVGRRRRAVPARLPGAVHRRGGDPRELPPGVRGERAARGARRGRLGQDASDRRRPPGAGFGVAVAHVYPSTLFGDALAEVERVGRSTVHALGLRDGIAYLQVMGDDGVARLIEVAARIPAGQMDSVALYGVGVDLVEIALRQALGQAGAGRARRARAAAADGDLVSHRAAGPATDRQARARQRAGQGARVPGCRGRRLLPGGWRRSGPCKSTATGAAT